MTDATPPLERPHRMAVRWWVLGVFVICMTTFGSGFTAYQIAENRDLGRDLRQSVHESCVADNAQDAKQLQLWQFVIDLSAKSPSLLTPEQRAEQTRLFNLFLADTFKATLCP